MNSERTGPTACEGAVRAYEGRGAAGSAPERACTADPSVPNCWPSWHPTAKRARSEDLAPAGFSERRRR